MRMVLVPSIIGCLCISRTLGRYMTGSDTSLSVVGQDMANPFIADSPRQLDDPSEYSDVSSMRQSSSLVITELVRCGGDVTNTVCKKPHSTAARDSISDEWEVFGCTEKNDTRSNLNRKARGTLRKCCAKIYEE